MNALHPDVQDRFWVVAMTTDSSPSQALELIDEDGESWKVTDQNGDLTAHRLCDDNALREIGLPATYEQSDGDGYYLVTIEGRSLRLTQP